MQNIKKNYLKRHNERKTEQIPYFPMCLEVIVEKIGEFSLPGTTAKTQHTQC